MPPELLIPRRRELKLAGDALSIRAEFQPDTFRLEDGKNPTIKLIASAGAAVRRGGYFDGGWEEFDELLSFEKGAHRDERLNSGRVNLLLDHNRFDVRDIFGVLSEPEWDRSAKKLQVTAKLSRNPDHAGLVQQVRDGILVNTSIGYRTFQVRDVTKKGDARRQIEAIDWETREVSLVSVPADPRSHVRSEPTNPGTTTTFVISSDTTERTMEPETHPTAPAPTDAARTTPPAAPTTPAPASPAASPATAVVDADRVAQAELDRGRTIRERLRTARLAPDDDFARSLLDDRAVTPDLASSRILQRLAQPNPASPEIGGQVRVGVEEGARIADALETMILVRSAQEVFIDGVRGIDGNVDRLKLRTKLQGNPFMHRSLLESGEEYLARVFNVRGLERMSRHDRAGVILRPRFSDEQRAGSVGIGHSTSDFPGILANVVNKVLRGRFELAPNTWSQWTNRGNLNDYKEAKRVQLGATPRLLQVREGAEYTYGTLGEQSEPIILAKWGRIVSLTREAMINDDLNAFGRISGQYGDSAMQLIADLVYAHLTGSTVMADGVALFHSTHKNLVTGSGNSLSAAGVAALSNLRVKARLQTSIDPGLAGTENAAFYQGVAIRHLRVPAELETAAQQLTTSIQAQQVTNVNPFQGSFASVMAEPRLSAASAIAFYGMSDPGSNDTIEVAFLTGEDGPMVETRMGFERDGVDIKVRMDVGTAPIDFRGLYKNEGTT